MQEVIGSTSLPPPQTLYPRQKISSTRHICRDSECFQSQRFSRTCVRRASFSLVNSLILSSAASSLLRRSSISRNRVSSSSVNAVCGGSGWSPPRSRRAAVFTAGLAERELAEIFVLGSTGFDVRSNTSFTYDGVIRPLAFASWYIAQPAPVSFFQVSRIFASSSFLALSLALHCAVKQVVHWNSEGGGDGRDGGALQATVVNPIKNTSAKVSG